MSTMKKIGALIMALAMCFALAMPAFAADTKGSITITNAQQEVEVEGKEGKQKNSYTAYMIFAASTTDGKGNDSEKPTATTNGTVVYTATKTQADWWKTNASGLFTFTDAGNGTYIVGTESSADEIAKFFNQNKDTIIAAKVLGEANPLSFNDKGEAFVTGLDLGYYFVSSNNGSVVSIDTTNNDVKIEDKNVYEGTGFTPDPDHNPDGELKNVYMVGDTKVEYKDVDGDGKVDTTPVAVNIGDTVTYQVSALTTNHVVKTAEGETTPHSEKVETLYITDVLDAGLDYVDFSAEKEIVVFVGDTEISNYTLKKNDRAFTVVIPWIDANGELLYDDGASVTLQYKAKVNSGIKMSQGQAVSENGGNEADLFYKSNPDDGDKPDPKNPDPDPEPGHIPTPKDPDSHTDTGVDGSEVSVYTYALAIKKVDGNTQKVLPGAKFTIARKDGTPVKVAAASDNGVYTYDPNGTVTELVTPETGIIIVKGVADGAYLATETEAPAGYNLMQGAAEFNTIVAGTTTTKTSVTTVKYYETDENGDYVKNAEGEMVPYTKDASGERYKLVNTKASDKTEVVTENGTEGELSEYAESMSIANYTGTELPSTGGMGTTLFYVVGGAMVLGAGVLLITKKRMAE